MYENHTRLLEKYQLAVPRPAGQILVDEGMLAIRLVALETAEKQLLICADWCEKILETAENLSKRHPSAPLNDISSELRRLTEALRS